MNEKLIYKGPIFDLIQTHVEVKGKLFQRDIIKVPGGVGLLVVENQQILLVRQHRTAVHQDTLEIPAGKLEYGEDPKETGFRELNEETGYTCADLKLIQHFIPTPAFCNETIWIYQAEGLKKAETRLSMDEDEEIETIWMPLKDAFEKVRKNEIQDAKTVIAIYYALLESRD